MTNANVHFRIDAELKEAVTDIAEAHGLSLSEFYRFLTEAFLTSDRGAAAGLDEEQAAELDEYREVREAERAHERRDRKESARRKRAREIGDIKRFQHYVQDSIREAWAVRAPPWSVKKDLKVRGEQIENWYETGLLTDAQHHEMHRYVYKCWLEYEDRWDLEEKDEEVLDDSGLDDVAGDSEEYKEQVEIAANVVENTGASCPNEIEGALDAAGHDVTKQDVLEDVHSEVARRHLEKAIDQFVRKGRCDPNQIEAAALWDPGGHSVEELHDYVEGEAQKRQLDDDDPAADTDAGTGGIDPPDPMVVAANGRGK